VFAVLVKKSAFVFCFVLNKIELYKKCKYWYSFQRTWWRIKLREEIILD